MTIPSFDFVNPQAPAPQAPQLSDELPDFGFVGGLREGRGFFSKLGHTLDNIRTTMQAELALGIDPGIINRVDPERRERIKQVMSYINEARASEPESVDIAIKDLSNFFSQMTTKGLSQKIGEVFDSMKEAGVGGTLGGIVSGVGQMAMAPLEMGAGVALTEEDMRPLTPIERASRIKETAAIAVSMGVGLGARVAARGATGLAAATAAKEFAKMGKLGKNALTGLAEGSVGGSVYGAIANANEEDQLAEILINGVVFAPVGAAFEAIGGKIGAGRAEKKYQAAADAAFIQNLRKTQFDENQTLPEVAAAVDALAVEDDIAVATVRSKLSDETTNWVMVAGVKDFASLNKFVSELGYNIATHGNDALVYNPNTLGPFSEAVMEVIEDFRSTGYYNGERVFYNGKEYQITNMNKASRRANLQDMRGGESFVVDMDQLRRSSEVIDLNIVKAVEEITGKTAPMYPEFKKFVLDKEAGTNFVDDMPSRTFLESVHEFAEARGLDPHLVGEQVKKSLFDEALDGMDEIDRKAIQQLQKSLIETEAKIDVETVALTNGMHFEEVEPGIYKIVDGESGRTLHVTTSVDDAKKWINSTGQAKGIDLDGGGNNGVPPDVGAPFASPPNPDNPWSTPYVFARGKMEEIVSAFNARITWFTPFMNIFTALDSKFGTQVFSRIYNATQDKAAITSNAKIAGTRRIRDRVENVAKGISGSRREIIGGYNQAMTPDEIIKLGDLNPTEVRWAKRIADSGVNVGKLFKYHKQVERATRDYPKLLDRRTAALNHAAEKLGMSPNDLEWYNNIFNKLPATGATIGPSVRLARAYSDGGESRPAYAARHKMTGQELRVAHELEKLHNEFAKEFGVDDYRKFNFYMSHAKLHTHGVVADALKYFDKVPADIKKFIETMQRTGELNPFEKDPIFALQRFVTAANDARYLDGAVKTARGALEEEILKVPDPAREGFRQLAERYLADLRGIPPAASRLTQQVVDNTSRDLKLDLELDVKRHIADAIITSISSSIQGFRVKYGIMDFTTTSSVYFARNGSKRTGNMWKYGKQGVDGITREALKEKGIIKDLSPIFLADLAEYGASSRTVSKAGQLYNKAVEVGFQTTGQKQIYEIAQAGAYLETWKHSGEWLRKLSRGEVTKAKAYKEMRLDTYELAAGKHFDDLVSQSKFEEAADFLGKQAIRELVGVYQMANSPYGWNTNTGRLIGQFGRYPAWIGAYTRRLASRGTRMQRAQNLMRFAVANSIIGGVGVAAGVNLFNWMPITGMLFTGGPASDMAMTAIEAVSGYGGEKELAQHRLRQYLLYDPFAERWNVGQPYLPGSYFLNDLVKASESEEGLEMLTRGLGLSQLNR